MPSAPASNESTESTLPHLSGWSFTLALAIVLGIFFGLHPVWKTTDASAVDATIVWSYAPIPLLVAVLLALERKLRWSSFLIETIKLTFVKFAITWLVANVLWSLTTPPVGHERSFESTSPAEQPGRFDVHEPPVATTIDPARTGSLAGIVTDAAGAPVAGAFVAVTGGLQDIVFAPPPDGLLLVHDGSGLQPDRAVLLVHEKLVVRSGTDALHTVCAFDEGGKQLFNLPIVPGAESQRMFKQPAGLVTLRCTVHGHSDREAVLDVVANPFAAWTGPDGRFAFEGVPAGDLEIAATGPGQAAAAVAPATQRPAHPATAARPAARRQIALAPGGAVDDLRLTLP